MNNNIINVTVTNRPFSLDLDDSTETKSDTKKPDIISSAYNVWKADPKPKNLYNVVTLLDPTIKQAISHLGPDSQSPIVLGRARLTAAKAIKSYDPTKGAHLKTYITGDLQRMQRAVHQVSDPLPTPERTRRLQAEIAQAANIWAADNGSEPTDEELADATKLPLKQITKVRTRMRSRMPMSTYEEGSSDDEDEGADVSTQDRSEYDDWMDACYHDLGDLDRKIMMYRTGYRGETVLSNNEISAKLKISPSVVSQRSHRIQEKLDQWKI